MDSLLYLAVTSVPADSRCATRDKCIWTGDGAVAIAYGLGRGASYPDTLHTNLDPRSVRYEGYFITLVDLMPYPETSGSIPPD